MKHLSWMCLFCGLSFLGWSQKDSQDGKIWLDGFARTFFSRDALPPNSEDTLSSRSIAQGYNLLDLNTHVNPSEDVEVFAQVRIRNEFGGFLARVLPWRCVNCVRAVCSATGSGLA